MKTLESNQPRRRRLRIAIALIYFTGLTGIVGCTLPDGVAAAGHGAEFPARLQNTAISDDAVVAAKQTLATRKTRSSVNCSGCGVVESMQKIDTHDELMGECNSGEFARSRTSGPFFFGVGGRGNMETLAEIVAAGVAGETRAKKSNVTTRHQIVVRLRDGSKQVFDEAAPRTVRVGDRITVIVAAARGND
jgi:hypothetical protein